MPQIALVTDSTAGLTSEQAAELDIAVVALHVLLDEVDHHEGVDVTPADVAAALRRGVRVRTSRSTPVDMLRAYEQAAAAGAEAIVSVHLSAQLSGTTEAAWLAARDAPVPVTVLDSRSTGLGLGFAVLAGARLAREGADLATVVAEIERRADATSVLCYVDTLEFLRRGGRIGAAASLLGTAFAVKPIIALVDGHVEPVEKQRTASRALARMVDLAAHAVRVGDGLSDVAVHHSADHARAATVVDRLTASAGESMRGGAPVVADLPAVLAVHAGPGAVAVVVSPSGR